MPYFLQRGCLVFGEIGHFIELDKLPTEDIVIIAGFIDFVHRPIFKKLENVSAIGCFRLQVRGTETPTQLYP